MPVATSVWQHADGDFELVHVNQPGVELTGGWALEQVGTSITDHYPADSHVVADLRRCLTMGSRVVRSGPVHAPSPAGERNLALTYGFVVPDLIMVCAHDLSAEIAAAAQADEATERFRAAFERAPVGMALAWLTPAQAGETFTVNASLCGTLRVAKNTLLRSSLFDRSHPDDAEVGRESIEAVIRGERPTSR